MRKKSLVKRVFNFGRVQNLDAANQIAEQGLRHGHVSNKDCNSDLKEPREGRSPVQQPIDEAIHRLSLSKCPWSLGKVKSSALLTRIIMQAWIVLLCEHHNTSRTFNGNQNWIRVSPDSFFRVRYKRLGTRLLPLLHASIRQNRGRGAYVVILHCRLILQCGHAISTHLWLFGGWKKP